MSNIPTQRWAKGDYEAAAQVIREIDAGMQEYDPTGLCDGIRDAIIELIIARFANLYSLDNPRFDGFEFNDAARGRKVRR